VARKLKISPEQSQFIDATRLFMICGLVFHHLFTLPGGVSHPRSGMSDFSFLVPEAINSWVHMAFMASVPLLSIISGYLFFRGGRFDYVAVLKKKFATVMLPSWLWCSIWLIFAALVFYASKGAISSDDYNFSEVSPLMVLNGIFGVTQLQYAYQFWFVHDLILTFMIFPILKFCLDRFAYLFLFLLFVLWLSPFEPVVFFRIDVLFFFVCGGVLANYDSRGLFDRLNQPVLRLTLPLVFIAALSLRALTFLLFSEDSVAASLIGNDYYLAILRILGVSTFAIWISWAQRNMTGLFNSFVNYSSYSFLIFAIHFPLISILRKLAEQTVAFDTPSSLFAAWLLLPVMTIVGCVVISIVAKTIFPRPTNLMAGNRLA
jgi:fucose 4-O-acetylase-like acetyltransferase